MDKEVKEDGGMHHGLPAQIGDSVQPIWTGFKDDEDGEIEEGEACYTSGCFITEPVGSDEVPEEEEE